MLHGINISIVSATGQKQMEIVRFIQNYKIMENQHDNKFILYRCTWFDI